MLKKLLGIFRRKKSASYINYGRYINKPVLYRALEIVMSVDQRQINWLINNRFLTLNGEEVTITHLKNRLHSGQYVLKSTFSNEIWGFRID